MKPSLNRFWTNIRLREKPSYPLFILSVLLGLMIAHVPGGVLGLAAAWTFERLRPPEKASRTGVMRNRTKGVINLIAVVILARMIVLFLRASQLDAMNSVGWASGVSTEWAIGSSSGCWLSIVIFSVFISTWLFVQASFARRSGNRFWRRVFIAFGVILLPFMHSIFGALWLLACVVLIVLILVSSFRFRLPCEWPVAVPPLPLQPAPNISTLETDLNALNRLRESNLLNEEEFGSQRLEILRRHGG